jgi:N-methylhydantoinase A
VRVSIDIGGTFTDCVVEEGGAIETHKAPTTPSDPTRGLLDVLGKAADAAGEPLEQFLARVEHLFHGTTLGTNLLLTKRGAKVALLTTQHFRDVIEIRRGVRNLGESVFNQVRAPYEPLVPRHLRFGIPERVLHTGEVELPLDEGAVEQAVRTAVAEDCGAIAIGFLHSYANQAHEHQAKAIAERVAPDLHVVCSSDLLPTRGEFERFSTAVVSGYIGRAVSAYLRNLEGELRAHGFAGSLLIMLSSALMQTVDQCHDRAVELLASGPAAAPAAALAVGNSFGHLDLIEIDMGGTSFDVCVIRGGAIPTTQEAWVGEERVATKMVDIHSLGAGGGSIAWIDALGLLRVGPQSAGADPGPAAYGKSDLPTVTDADLILGYLPSDFFLGGEMSLDADRAASAVATVGEPLGLGLEETADAIFRTVTVNMAGAVTEVCTKRGHDVRSFAIVAGGGAGGIHSAAIAEHLRIPTVIFPTAQPVLSAMGMLIMEIGQELAKVGTWNRTEVTAEELETTFEEMTAAEEETFRRMGVDLAEVTLTRSIAARYQGQFHEVAIDVLPGDDRETLIRRFHDRYEEIYGYSLPWRAVEILECHLRGSVAQAPPARLASTDEPPVLEDARVGDRHCYLRGSWEDVPVYRRELLDPGHAFAGPALIDSRTSTILVPESFDASVDEDRNVILHLRDATGVPTSVREAEQVGA